MTKDITITVGARKYPVTVTSHHVLDEGLPFVRHVATCGKSTFEYRVTLNTDDHGSPALSADRLQTLINDTVTKTATEAANREALRITLAQVGLTTLA